MDTEPDSSLPILDYGTLTYAEQAAESQVTTLITECAAASREDSLAYQSAFAVSKGYYRYLAFYLYPPPAAGQSERGVLGCAKSLNGLSQPRGDWMVLRNPFP